MLHIMLCNVLHNILTFHVRPLSRRQGLIVPDYVISIVNSPKKFRKITTIGKSSQDKKDRQFEFFHLTYNRFNSVVPGLSIFDAFQNFSWL